MKQYVRHESGQGPIYEVGLDKGSQYVAKEIGNVDNEYYSLPAKDYVPCDPPEEWEDVTGEFYESDLIVHQRPSLYELRIRKIEYSGEPCFIIERKIS